MATASSLQSVFSLTMATPSISLRIQHQDADSDDDDSDDDDSTDDGTTVGATRIFAEDEMDDFLAAEFDSVDQEPVYLPQVFASVNEEPMKNQRQASPPPRYSPNAAALLDAIASDHARITAKLVCLRPQRAQQTDAVSPNTTSCCGAVSCCFCR